MFDIRIEGLDELKAAWSQGCDKLVLEVRHGAVRAGQTAATQIKHDAPVRDGELVKSIRSRVRATKDGASGFVEATAEHASFVHDGTPPHIITAKNAKALRFNVGGATRFAKSVKHPGTKPNDFVTAGAQEGQQVLDHDAEAAVARLKAKIEG